MSVVTLANGRSFSVDRGTLLDAALAHGLTLEHSCRTGRCGSCKVRVLAGRSVPVRDETSALAHVISRRTAFVTLPADMRMREALLCDGPSMSGVAASARAARDAMIHAAKSALIEDGLYPVPFRCPRQLELTRSKKRTT